MRWPFGPPHLTLKPSKKRKSKTKKQTKNNQKEQKQEQQHPTTKKHKANKQKKSTDTKKQKQETQKHLNLPDPNKQEEATPQSPQNWEKNQAYLTLLQLYQTKNTMTLKPGKRNKQKSTLCHVQKQPTIFHQFSVFVYMQCLFCNCCVSLKTL